MGPELTKTRDVLAVFNRGRISRLALARTDVARVALSADVQTNWMPRRLGSMMLRPGLGYINTLLGDGALLPFIYSTADTAILELTPSVMRVHIGGTALVTRNLVGTTITNGAFTTDLTGWTDADEAGAASTWVSGQMQLVGTGFNSAKRQQALTVAAPDQAVAHGIRIVVNRGPLLLRIGTTAGADDVFRQAVLRTGRHSISFTPGAATVYIEFSSSLKWPVLIESITMEGAGTLELPTPWTTADLCKAVRWQQNADVVFCACASMKQRRIERRPNNSWSIVEYDADDGPFLTENVENIRITPSALSGAITLTASRAMFRTGHVGALFRLSSQGQRVEADLTADSTYTGEIRVTGVGADRAFTVTRAGTWAGTVSLQRSISEPGTWVTVATYTTNASVSYDDGLDNSIAYYRIGFEVGAYTSGTAELALEFSAGSITGTARVVGYTSETVVSAVVLEELGGTQATEVWAEGAWSDERDWPDAVSIFQGRLWWSGGGRNWGSAPDAFTTFDPDIEGDSQPINRRVGEGAVNATNWMLPLQNLIVGTDDGEYSVRSTSFDEPVTPSNYNTQGRTTKGSSLLPAAYADGKGYFVGQSGWQVFELEYDAASYGYQALDLMTLAPEVGKPSIIRIVVQQTPDFRLTAVRSDGTVAVMIRDSGEDVLCWVDVETDGLIEDVVVLPSADEDRMFYRVARVIDGVTVRYLERWAVEDDARGGNLNLMADSFITGTGDVDGLDHLEGETVVVWADGVDQGTFEVVSGACDATFDDWMAGLPYTGQYKSAKLAGQTALGLSLTQRSRINSLGLVLADTHAQGLRYGPTFETMDPLPMMESGAAVDPDSVWDSYDADMIEFPGDWSTDNRICLEATAPRPCTVLALVMSVDRQDHD